MNRQLNRCNIEWLLAQEYEKRLLMKDREVKEAQVQVAELAARLQGAEAALADTSRMLPAPEPHAGPNTIRCTDFRVYSHWRQLTCHAHLCAWPERMPGAIHL